MYIYLNNGQVGFLFFSFFDRDIQIIGRGRLEGRDLNDAQQDVKNYPYLGGCYPPRLKPEVDNIPRDSHYPSHRTKAEFSNCFIASDSR